MTSYIYSIYGFLAKVLQLLTLAQTYVTLSLPSSEDSQKKS